MIRRALRRLAPNPDDLFAFGAVSVVAIEIAIGIARTAALYPVGP